MYSLRNINNLYEGGTRSDFIVVGHPEFCQGQAGSDRGYGPGWDTTPVPTYPKEGPAVARLKKAGSEQLLRRLTLELGSKPDCHARAMANKRVPAPSEKLLRYDFDAFLDALRNLAGDADCSDQRRRSVNDALPQLSSDGRLTTGFLNSVAQAGVSSHTRQMHAGLYRLAERLKSEPKVLEHELLMSGSWRQWAAELETVRKQRRQVEVKHSRSFQKVKS
eukprot:TRINITY_DN50191_c0_g1_i1.p1 TRINITY_DN50191_c0_g1~~TRINITY_DN50191_c0_g1_i1.p1  ORF type:complete len:220 (-),score=40.97 TRINITY_DN50191_c0_g1_i1:6-665(-)